MSEKAKHRVCPVDHAGSLDNRFRRWVHNPKKILGPYIEKGMTVLDVGCGPGFFTMDMADMVGETGRVVASDLQEGMLEKVRDKIQGTGYADRIILHNSGKEGLNTLQGVDFALAFYMVHEVPDQERFFQDLYSTLNFGGRLLVVEPPFHVLRKEMEKMIDTAGAAGFKDAPGPKMLFSKTAIFEKKDPE